jgi:putative NADH-flavin reductase
MALSGTRLDALLPLGATGATGRHLLEQALAQGHHVTALVRNPAKLHRRSPDLTVVQGDVTDRGAVERAVRSQDAVLCALGSSTPLRHDPTLVVGIGNLVEAMERLQVKRLVYLSFLGVHDGRGQLSLFGRHVVAPLLLGKVAADHERKEAIQQSSLEWVIVRPPRLTNGRRTGTYRSGADIQATMMIPRVSRADLADFMLGQLTSDTYLRKTPAIMY